MMAAKTAQKYLTFLRKHSATLADAQPEEIFLSPASGGDINDAFSFTYHSNKYFVKFKRVNHPGFFRAEAKGLQTLAKHSSFCIPEVLETYEDEDGGFLLLSFLEGRGTLNPEEFAEQLAGLHQQTADAFGLDHHNFIGSLSQNNTRTKNWMDFFTNQRVLPLAKKAFDSDKLNRSAINQLEKILGRWDELIPVEKPALLHGDLWRGNAMQTTIGASIYDPAVYYGHREMDVSMMYLFGGFSPRILEAYHTCFPLEPNFMERKELHNIYPLLVHTVLFGGSYGRQVQGVVERFG